MVVPWFDAHHHCLCHDLSAPLTRRIMRWNCTRAYKPFFSILALVDNRLWAPRSGWRVHRKHHAKVETDEDPHSPVIQGINKVLWEGVELYRTETEAANQADTGQIMATRPRPIGWNESLYSKYTSLGINCLLTHRRLCSLFGVLIGISIWAIQMAWVPFLCGRRLINGAGHWYGYRNFESADALDQHCPRWQCLSVAKSCITTTTPLPVRPSFLTSAGSLTSVGSTSDC